MFDVSLRLCHPSDVPLLYRICHETGLSGQDASSAVPDADLIGQTYVGPYLSLEPEHCFVAVIRGNVVGYIVGAPDAAEFHRKCEERWFPILRHRYPLPPVDDVSPTATFIRSLHRGHPPSRQIDLAQYPANLHINLLPQARGHGVGRHLMLHLFAELRKSDIPGVHLYVSRSNHAAMGFYEHIGFECIDDAHFSRGYGIMLS
jgi:ribosomal protein S18 acetylase RimI-like enzyme